MGLLNETESAHSNWAALQDGLEQGLDLKEYEFQVYSRCILPLDGSVFWLPTKVDTITGSLHYSQEIVLESDQTYVRADALFTASEAVTQFAGVGPEEIRVLSIDGFRVAFSQQTGFYSQAQLWHYVGQSVPPALLSLLLDSPDALDVTKAVTSNSLALWLQLNTLKAFWFSGMPKGLTLYPSGQVPTNLQSPYGVLEITGTQSLQGAPIVTADTSSQFQLCSERVKVTMFGLQNNAAQDFLRAVWQYSATTDNFGIQNMPAVRDERPPVTGLQTVGMVKVIDFEVSYYQTRVRAIARQLIKAAAAQIVVNYGAASYVLATDPGGETLLTESGIAISQ